MTGTHRVHAARLTAFAVILLGLVPRADAGLCPGIAIPAYFYPGPLWTTAIASVPRTAIMIMNPDSGPGAGQNPDYTTAVSAAQTQGIKILGYVHTSYGARPATDVLREVDLYKSWYGVDGIFLDETADTTANISYYQALADYIRAGKGGYVMLNPGTIPSREYIKLADTTIVFEDTYAAFQAWIPPAWVYRYPAEKFTHLVHTAASSTQMLDAAALSKSRNAGLLYIHVSSENFVKTASLTC